MAERSHEESINYYLDDELSADERADVERMLADSDSLRQLCDELRAIRAALRSLPAYRLEPDFAQRVIEKAERTVLTAPEAAELERANWSPSPSQPADAPAGLDSPRPYVTRPFASRRSWLWAGAAVAAAVLVAVYAGDPAGDSGDQATTIADRGENAGGTPGENATAGSGAKGRMEIAAASRDGGGGPVAEKTGLANGAQPAESLFAAERNQDERTPGPHDNSLAKRPARSGPASDSGDRSRDQNQTRQAALARIAGGADGLPSLGLPSLDAGGVRAEQLRLVYCDVAVDAVQRGEIKSLLARNGIELENEAAVKLHGAAGHAAADDAPPSQKFAAEFESAPAIRKHAQPAVEVIYVEGSREQINATLADLKAHGDVFAAVSDRAVPAPQLQFGQASAQSDAAAAVSPDRLKKARDQTAADAAREFRTGQPRRNLQSDPAQRAEGGSHEKVSPAKAAAAPAKSFDKDEQAKRKPAGKNGKSDRSGKSDKSQTAAESPTLKFKSAAEKPRPATQPPAGAAVQPPAPNKKLEPHAAQPTATAGKPADRVAENLDAPRADQAKTDPSAGTATYFHRRGRAWRFGSELDRQATPAEKPRQPKQSPAPVPADTPSPASARGADPLHDAKSAGREAKAARPTGGLVRYKFVFRVVELPPLPAAGPPPKASP